jgi:hypothetical protein
MRYVITICHIANDRGFDWSVAAGAQARFDEPENRAAGVSNPDRQRNSDSCLFPWGHSIRVAVGAVSINPLVQHRWYQSPTFYVILSQLDAPSMLKIYVQDL